MSEPIVKNDALENFIVDQDKLNKEFARYRKTMTYLGCDMPIEALCLSPGLEKALLAAGIERLYDAFEFDLSKIKGVGNTRLRELTARLDEFMTMSI